MVDKKYDNTPAAIDNRIKELIAKFVLRYNYWGYLFSRIRRKAVKNFGSIMAVRPESDGTISLIYEPDLVAKTDDSQIIIILEHEGMHLLNKHIVRLLRILSNEPIERMKGTKSRAFNKAADCAVNSQANIRKPIIVAGEEWTPLLPELFDMEEGKLTEEYFNEFLKKAKENSEKSQEQGGCGHCQACEEGHPDHCENNTQQCPGYKACGECDSCKGGGGAEECEDKQPCDCKPAGPGQAGNTNCARQGGDGTNHDEWTKNIQDVSDVNSLSRKVDQHVQDIIKESAKVFTKERGTLPSHISELIQDALAPPKAPYYQIIRKLVRGSRLTKFKRSPTRINRKRTYVFNLDDHGECLPEISPFPGKSRDTTFDICVLIDTSGSMGPDDILEGLSGVKNIIEKDRHCYTTVLEVDAGVEKEYSVKKLSDIQFDIKGRGGTTLLPGLERARELNCDVCLAFTDGYCENLNSVPRKLLPKKLIWVITPDGTAKTVNETGFIVRI